MSATIQHRGLRLAARSPAVGGLLAVLALTLVVVLATASIMEFSRPDAVGTLTAVVRVVGASLCLLAGALRLSLHHLTGDRDSAVLGICLLLVGAVLVPSTVLASTLAPHANLLEPFVRLAESLAMLGLLRATIDAQGHLHRTPRKTLLVLLPSVAFAGWLVSVAITWALAWPHQHAGVSTWGWALAANVIASFVWATSAVAMTARPWPPGGRETLAFLWVATLVSVMRTVGYAGTPALVLAAVLVVLVGGITAAARAMRDLDEASSAARNEAAARVTILTDTRLDLVEESARGSALRHDALNSLAALRAALECLEIDESDLESRRSRILRSGLGELGHLEHLLTRRSGAEAVSFDVDEVIEGVVESRRPTGLEVAFVPTSRSRAWGVPGDFATVLQNLLVNAHVHGGGRGVTVSCFPAEDYLDVRVRDRGPGIPAEARPRIFDPGVRASSRPGAGLGLHISRQLMREQGGDLILAPAPRGTEFVVRIPLARADQLL